MRTIHQFTSFLFTQSGSSSVYMSFLYLQKKLNSKEDQKESMQKMLFPQVHYLVSLGKRGLTASNSLK